MRKDGSRSRAGFTLIELSIVLIIIGLIIGGILTGQSLVRSSEIMSVITDVQKFSTAATTFRGKYNGLPGDMLDATNYWGTDPQGCPDTAASPPYTTTQTKTCNGNGNGLIENSGTGAANQYENFRAWQQLADANLIQGGYTGVYGPLSTTDTVPGLNGPATKIPNGGFEWAAFSTGNVWAQFSYAQLSVQYLAVGARAPSVGNLLGWLFTPQAAAAIDSKIDDGLPQSGSVLGSSTFDGNGSCQQNYPTIVYNITTTPYFTASYAPYCILLFQIRSF